MRHRSNRIAHRATALIAAVAALALAIPAAPAAALSPTACRVTNLRTGKVTTTLAPAVTAARARDILTIRGTCTASLTIEKRIELRGVRPGNAGVPTLIGGAAGSVLWIGEAGNVRLRGLTITGGTGTSQGDQRNGGGILVDGRVVLVGVHVTNNAVDGDGGGIFAFGGAVVIGGSSVIDQNAATDGGGVAVGLGTLKVAGSARIADNVATGLGGGIVMGYGNLLVTGTAVVTGNTAGGRGGGIAIGGGSTAIGGDARITQNTANASLGAGGGISITSDAVVTIRERAEITGNDAPNGSGAGISVAGTLSLTGEARVSGNQAFGYGGGVWLETAPGGSALLMTGSSTITMNVGGGLTRVIGTTYNDADCGTRIVNNVPQNCQTVVVKVGG